MPEKHTETLSNEKTHVYKHMRYPYLMKRIVNGGKYLSPFADFTAPIIVKIVTITPKIGVVIKPITRTIKAEDIIV